MILVNIWAVLVSAIAAFLIGMAWYGPLFGAAWIAAIKVDPQMGVTI